mgnify:CR=1 FL=1
MLIEQGTAGGLTFELAEPPLQGPALIDGFGLPPCVVQRHIALGALGFLHDQAAGLYVGVCHAAGQVAAAQAAQLGVELGVHGGYGEHILPAEQAKGLACAALMSPAKTKIALLGP